MRTLFIVDSFPSPANLSLVYRFAGLFKQGADVHVLCKEPLASVLWQSFTELRGKPNLRQRLYDGLATAVALNDKIFALDPDLIIFENAQDARQCMYLREFANSNVVVQCQAEDLSYFEAAQPDRYAEIWERADALFFESEILRQLAVKRGCPPEKAYFIVPCHLPQNMYVQPERELSEDTVGTESRPLRILSLARLTWQNGYDYALQVIRHLKAAGVACDYRVVGQGPCAAELAATSRQLMIADAITWQVDDTVKSRHEALAWADLLLHTAVAPSSCQPVFEAQAMQLPVVCTDAGSLPAMVQDGQSGCIVPRRQPELLAEKLIDLAQAPEQRHKMGQAGRDHFLQYQSDKDFFVLFAQIIQDILDSAS